MYTVPLESQPAFYDIKKSRFIGYTHALASPNELNLLLSQVKTEWAGATHYVYAYRLPNGIDKAYDDGEPHATAGLPILHLLAKKNLFHTLIIVVRYYGGIKLGHGGLVHAYQKAAQLSVDNTKWGQLVPVFDLSVTVPYTSYDMVRRLVEPQVARFYPTFTTDVAISFSIAQSDWEPLYSQLKDLTAGAFAVNHMIPRWDVVGKSPD